MTISSLAAAATACDFRDWQLTNLELQKVLYVAHMVHLGRTGDPLVNEEFEAWDYGPVLPDVYRVAAMFGRDPVQRILGAMPVAADTSERRTIQEVSTYLAKFSASQLVGITHWSRGAWASVYRPGSRHIRIPNAEVAREFKLRNTQPSAQPAVT